MIIEKKILPKYFNDIVRGAKTFELRLADFDVKPGDTLILKEVNPETHELTGRELSKEVTYVTKTKDVSFWTKEEIDTYGYQIISLKNKEIN